MEIFTYLQITTLDKIDIPEARNYHQNSSKLNVRVVGLNKSMAGLPGLIS